MYIFFLLIKIITNMEYEVTTTNMRKIIVDVDNENEAVNVASSQFKDWESVMMISSNGNI